jgi:hypothetical protein
MLLFGAVIQYGLVGRYLRFGGTYYVNHHRPEDFESTKYFI